MLILEPKADLWTPQNEVQHVTRCARVSYLSQSKGEQSDKALYQRLIDSGHLSTLRHFTHYYYVPSKDADSIMLMNIPQSEFVQSKVTDNGDILIVANGQFVYENKGLVADFEPYEISESLFCGHPFSLGMVRYTFCLTTQISTSRELNRTSPNNITESSTRYIKFGGKVEPSIVRPHWMMRDDATLWIANKKHKMSSEAYYYCDACEESFRKYNILMNDFDFKPQEARGVLPLDTTTKVVYTYSVDEWKHIIDLRYHGTTGAPHGNAKLVIGLVREQLNMLGYNL